MGELQSEIEKGALSDGSGVRRIECVVGESSAHFLEGGVVECNFMGTDRHQFVHFHVLSLIVLWEWSGECGVVVFLSLNCAVEYLHFFNDLSLIIGGYEIEQLLSKLKYDSIRYYDMVWLLHLEEPKIIKIDQGNQNITVRQFECANLGSNWSR